MPVQRWAAIAAQWLTAARQIDSLRNRSGGTRPTQPGRRPGKVPAERRRRSQCGRGDPGGGGGGGRILAPESADCRWGLPRHARAAVAVGQTRTGHGGRSFLRRIAECPAVG